VGDFLIGGGVFLIVVGVLWKYGLLDWFGNLPGDIKYSTDNFYFFMPISSMLLISAVISLVLWFMNR